MIDPLAFIFPSELPPDAATETTLNALKSKFDTPLIINKDGLATGSGQAAIVEAIAAIPDSTTDVSTLAKEATLGQLKTLLGLQAKLTDSQPVNLQVADSAIASGAGAANAQTLRVVQSTDDILRLRQLTPRKPAFCWLCGQNATDTATVAEFTGGTVPIKAVAPIKGSGIDRAADPLMCLTLRRT